MPNQSSRPPSNPELFRTLVEQGRDVFFRFRPGKPSGFDYLSPSVTELTGYPVEAFMTDPDLFRSIVHPDDRWLLVPGVAGISESSTIRWVRQDGTIVCVEQRT